jgi:hypothetical protein
LSIDEQADLMLKSKAHQMTETVSKGTEHATVEKKDEHQEASEP